MAVSLPALYHLMLPREPHTPASVIACSTDPFHTCAVSVVEPVLFLNTVPLEDVIVSEIASCPAAPVAPCLATLYCVAVPPLVYVNPVLVPSYCPADTDGGVDCHPLEGADVFDEDAAYVMSAFEIPLPVAPVDPLSP